MAVTGVFSLKVLLSCCRGLFLHLTQTSVSKDYVELLEPEAWEDKCSRRSLVFTGSSQEHLHSLSFL